MNQKTTIGKTNKYSGVVKSVKDTQKPEEPKITADQVARAFHSFGFEPNQRNHNDIGYWTMKGISEAPKLMEELHKRRMDLNNTEDQKQKEESTKKKAEEDRINQHNESKQALPRLSDQEIAAIYDEYGLPTPDPEWVRNHMPNDPKKIRSILEMQRKHADDLLKKHSKNTVNSIPEIPKMSSGMSMAGAPMMGRGGPTPPQPGPMDIQGGMVPDTSSSTPFFIGDHALVQIVSPQNPNSGTLWLVDVKKKVLRPILSEQALDAAFEDPEAAKKAIITVSSQALGKGGPLEGFTPLKQDQGMKDDGSMDPIDFSSGQLQNRYGQQQDPAAENKALSMLDGTLGGLNSPQGGEQPQDVQPPQELPQ